MAKHLLMFERQSVCYNTINIFSEQIASRLMQRGYEIDWIRLLDQQHYDWSLLKERLEQGVNYDGALIFNASQEQNTSAGGENVFDAFGIPFWDYILDGPMERYHDLQLECKNFHSICLDRDHVNYIEQYHSEIQSAHFLPLGGFQAKPEYIRPFEEREYGLVFTASYDDRTAQEQYLFEQDSRVSSIAGDAIDYMLDNRNANDEEVLRVIARDRGYDIQDTNTRSTLELILSAVNRYYRSFIREELVRYLAASGATCDIFGNGWQNLDVGDWGMVRIHPAISYQDTASLYGNSKLVLNVLPRFYNGTHDRVATTLLNGAICLTDQSGFLNGMNAEVQCLEFFDRSRPDLLGETAMNLLKREDVLADKLKSGRRYAEQCMTWDFVTDKLQRLIEDTKGL